jgi:hypothetical protein
MYGKLGLSYRMSLSEFINEINKRHWCNMDKFVDLNLLCGNKNQYASCIPHLQIGINRPLKYANSKIII